MKKILFLDDEQRVLQSLRRVLLSYNHAWEMVFVDRSSTAWQYLQEGGFDAMVADIRMPGMTGLELLERIQSDERTREIPVVLLTGLLDARLKRRALELGAIDLLNKPVQTEDLVARLRSVLRLKSCQDELRTCNRLLEDRVLQRTEELVQSQLGMIWRLAKVAEFRDEQAGNHVLRVGAVSREIATAMGKNHRFVENLFLAAPLHDIGKIAVADQVLLKRGRLSPGEWEVMREHCVIGERMLREESKVKRAFLEWRGACSSAEGAEVDNAMLQMAAIVALSHHEKWDGTGYPHGLSGTEIPLEARIVAIADVFDALCSPRPYKPAYPEDKALQIIRESIGSSFDPEVHEAFTQALPEIRAIRRRFPDDVRAAGEPDPSWLDRAEELLQQLP